MLQTIKLYHLYLEKQYCREILDGLKGTGAGVSLSFFLKKMREL